MKKNMTLILFLLFGIIAVLTGTYAFYVWNSSEDTNTAISFTTSNDFSCSAKGSNLISSDNVTLIPTNCNSKEHVIKKKIVTNLNNTVGSTYLSMWLDINSIGSYLANSDNFRYALTTSEDSCDTGVIYAGNFKDLQVGDKSNLIISQEFSSGGEQTYYLWLWLDEAEAELPPEDVASRTFAVSLNGECSDEGPTNAFEITSLSNNYQILKATAVNFRNDIVSYAVTTTNSVDSWIDIPESEQGNLYNLEYIASYTGTYYVWFKDSSGETVNKALTISTIDTTGPVCTWGNFDANNIKNGDSASVTLTCVDPEVGISDGSVNASDITVANSNVTIKNVTSEEVNNGYKYTITIIGTSTDGSTSLSLKENTIKNKVNRGNSTNSSGMISVSNKDVFDGYTITLSNNTYTYDGTEKKPSVIISKDSTVLKAGTDYALRYVNNINAGTATVVISGKGSFSGDTSKTFIINKADCVCTINSVPTLKYIDASSGNITYNCTGDGSLSVISSKTNVVSVASINNNKATLGAVGIGTSRITVGRVSGNNYNSCKTYRDVSVAGETYTITYQDEDRKEFSGTHEEGYPETYISGVETVLDIPTKKGYTFMGYYKTYNTSDNIVTKLTEESGDLTLYAKWKDNILPYGIASLSLNNGKFTLKLSNQGDDGSGLTGTYGFALTTNSNCSAATYTNQTGVSKEYSGSYANGTTYYGCIKLIDNAGNIAYLSSAGIKYSYINETNTYTTVGEQIYTVPATGTYRLEVWGAQGGSANGYLGGYGGYSTGKVNLDKGDKLYINIGGQGTSGTSGSVTGGYNGGGSGYAQGNYSSNVGSGGGATHIATVSGLLSTLTSKISNILIVAGGGGGSSQWNYSSSSYVYSSGGPGGGIEGMSPVIDKLGSWTTTNHYGQGGTQTTGGQGISNGVLTSGSNNTSYTGKFGLGASVDSSTGDTGATGGGGGGGGYYGGGVGGVKGGAGGSGYIGNSLLTDKYMYCYNCTTSTDTATKTNTTTDVSDTPTTDYVKSGDGVARITYQSTPTINSLLLTYNNNGGLGCYSKSIVTGETYGELCIPTRDGYSFSGWYTDANDGTLITSSTSVTVTANQTIYAHWNENTKPVITFSPDGNDNYVSGSISSIINVNKGSNRLDASTFKYEYSKNNVIPNNDFMTGNSYTLENATGIYYLIAKACDFSGECVTEMSKAFYVDNTKPTGSVLLSQYKSSIIANVSATDEGSGIKNYGYLITTSDDCPSSGYVTSSNTQYTFNVPTSGTYRICAKITDKAENTEIINNTITVELTEITYGTMISSYSCGNKTVGKEPYVISYTGNCEVVDDGNDNWKVRFLTSGTLNISTDLNVDTFLVGGGGAGAGAFYVYTDDTWWANGAGGAGGYTKTYRNVNIKSSDTYTITVGAGGVGSAGGDTSLVGGSINHIANGGARSNGAGGSGGGGGCVGNGYGCSLGVGGKYGNSGTGGVGSNGGSGESGGQGQGTTTCEFEQSASGSNTDLTGCATGVADYGGGGNGGGTSVGTANTGNGGDGASSNGLNWNATTRTGNDGGSGIVIIRNSRSNPEVTFTPNGNTKYVNSVSATIDVNKGYNDLDTSTYKYTFSTSRTATPDKSFTRGTSYTFNGLSGIYYLVAKACDTTGTCTTQVSSAFYLDNTKPTASLSLTTSGFAVNATVSNVVDAESGLKNYGYLITTESTCPTSGYVTSTSSSYKFMVSESGTYRVCVKLTDNTGNVNYINSTIKASVSSSYYEKIANSYKCNNVSKGSAPYLITYAGNCQLVNDGNGNWRLKLLTSNSGGSGLSINESIYVDIFMVGGGSGGSGAFYVYTDDTWWANGSGGAGGYTKTIKKVTLNSETYTAIIGAGGSAGTVGGNTSFVGGNINQIVNGGGAGSGGSGGGGGCVGNGYGCTLGVGGKYGNAGTSGVGSNGGSGESGGKGQGTTTCEFGQSASGSNTDLSGCASGVADYGAGGNGGGTSVGTANTGNGGDGASSNGLNYNATTRSGYAGGSGIIIIRNAR